MDSFKEFTNIIGIESLQSNRQAANRKIKKKALLALGS